MGQIKKDSRRFVLRSQATILYSKYQFPSQASQA